MEIALIDCTDCSPFNLSFPAKFQVVVFCLATEALRADQGATELRDFRLPEASSREQRKYWVRTSGLLQLGYLCGVLSPHRVTVYSERVSAAQAPFSWEVQLLGSLSPPKQYVTPQFPDPEPRSDHFQTALLTHLSFDVSLNCLRALLQSPGSNVLKRDSLLNRLRNWSSSALVSMRKQASVDMFPSEEDVAQKAFSALSALEVFEAQGQMVRIKLPCVAVGEVESWLRSLMPALSP